MKKRVLLWSQHLLGIGHFMRASNVASALAEQGFEVTVASGGMHPSSLDALGYRLVQLPAVRAKDAFFDSLVDINGLAVEQSLLAERQRMLLALYDDMQPDCIVTETFPFGRRLLEDELMALLAHARARSPRPVIISSVRDVLQRPRKAARAASMVARARMLYDLVLVHSDPAVIPATLAFPELAGIDDLLRYTGFIGPTPASPTSERHGVLVTAGGGAVGHSLIAAALAAKPLTRLADRVWTVVTGPLGAEYPKAPEGVRFVKSLPNLASILAKAELSISQAGYNTMVEILAGQTPSVVVPFETDREREQVTRAMHLAQLGLVTMVQATGLCGETLARAIDERYAAGMVHRVINLDGRTGTVAAIRSLIGGA
jgi:predicted glycosyltransferase